MRSRWAPGSSDGALVPVAPHARVGVPQCGGVLPGGTGAQRPGDGQGARPRGVGGQPQRGGESGAVQNLDQLTQADDGSFAHSGGGVGEGEFWADAVSTRCLPSSQAVIKCPRQRCWAATFSRDFSGTFSSVTGTFQGRSAVQTGKAVTELKEPKPLVRGGFVSTR